MAINGITLVVGKRAYHYDDDIKAAPSMEKMNRDDGSILEEKMKQAKQKTRTIWAKNLVMTSLTYLNR